MPTDRSTEGAERWAAYDEEFYDANDEGRRRSAEAVLRLVLPIVEPAQVVDVGCGRGQWLAAAHSLGVPHVFGVDGPHVDREQLAIPRDAFLVADLEGAYELPRRYDLAISVEVAEHLSSVATDHYLDSLTGAAPVILFSAAVPGQGGQHHVNEQWPAYWAARFARRGYACIDGLRPRIWCDDDISFWYRQNLLLFADASCAPALSAAFGVDSTTAPLPLVHPELLALKETAAAPAPHPLRRYLSRVHRALRRP